MGTFNEFKKEHYSTLIDELTDELEEMTRERNIWRATCAIGFVVFVLLGYFGFW